ncbi:hypothetical protein EJ05DRAFT_422492, partial [Pseudovirgaria hyperparasitica]
RRPGGYGGFDDSQSLEEEPKVGRPSSIERRQAQRRSGDFNGRRDRSGGKGYGEGDGGKQIEKVLQYIKQDWDYMAEDECVPVQIALKLLDPSSLGLANRYRDFQNTHQRLQDALKAIVNEHHQGFNSSIGTFHKIQSSLQFSQNRVRTLKDSLVVSKTNLATTKPELKGLATASQNYDDMLQVLATIEELQLVPEKLEARISEKRFLTAVEILQDALVLIRKSEMESIGALSDLKVYLSNQEHSLTDILIEELHSHLYLKSPYCEDRWKVYAQNQPKAASADGSTTIDSRSRALYYFLERLDTSEAMIDDASRNPEADTFHYIHLLIESLNKLGRLDIAIDTIEQRLPIELSRVGEKSNNEVAQRHPSTLRAYANKGYSKYDFALDTDDARSALLNDLLWTLYARFEAIAEGHRVVHDVVVGILRRERQAEDQTLTRGFKELWKLFQSEIRSLLHDYLATDDNPSYRPGQATNASGNPFQKAPRDKNKRMFKLSEMDLKSTELATDKDDLEFILKSSVPGLVSAAKQPDGSIVSNSAAMHDGSATGHKLLVEPSVFNMGLLLPPSLDFLSRLKEVVPPNSDIILSTLTSFLDDFLVNVFHPQLDETLVELCAQTFIEVDAFQQDSQWAQVSQKPVFKGTTRFFGLIIAFCRMLDNLPHDQSISQLIITQMVTYYDKCFGWYKALVSRTQPKAKTGSRLKKSAAFVEMDEFTGVLKTLLQPPIEDVDQVLTQEINVLINLCDEDPLEEADLILQRKSITGLCMLYTSMKWLAAKVNALRYISDRATNSSAPRHSGPGQPKRNRWTLVATSSNSRPDNQAVYLPLAPETAIAFDGVVASFSELASSVLQTLHFEMRCHVLHAVTASMRGSFALEQEVSEPDASIAALNSDLVGFDEDLGRTLPAESHAFVVCGIGMLLSSLLLHLMPRVAVMNDLGHHRLHLNVLVLQQNLKNIEPASDLSRATYYFALFKGGPEEIVRRAKEIGDGGAAGKGYSYEELKVMVELCFSAKVSGRGRREEQLMAKRGLEDCLLRL